ncbi:MAG TPA: hypothetical protein VNY07_02200 [Chthoniobacterales bacterium]|nr:hypothetical protein [Chthoniobacterales bacterium]
MKIRLKRTNTGSTIMCALCTILIISLIGANVLLNCTTRYNVSSKQVKGWKEALYAAEGGADIAFSEVRKLVSSPSTAFQSGGWTPTPGSFPIGNGPYYFGQKLANGNGSLSAQVTVDQGTFPVPSGPPQNYYRIRSQGTATLLGLPRAGMDDRMDSVTRGDSLLRKIDFSYDHFKATYGDGDGNGLAIQTVQHPQITRRIETIAVPQFSTLFSGLETTGTFYGPGSAGWIDSYDSKNGPYTFVANNPSAQHYNDSHSGNVSDGTSTFTEFGSIYGNVTTNGGTVTHKSNGTISGTIDNNVAFTVPPVVRPDTTGYTTGGGSTLNLPTGTTVANPATYYYTSLSDGLTINGRNVAHGLPNAGKPAETYVTIVVGSANATDGDVGGRITVGAGVNAKIYFTGDLSTKARDLVNNNVDGATGIYNADGTPSTDYSLAGHLQFYGVSPTDGSTEAISISPPGNVYAAFYAPNADFTVNGNPDIFGAVVCHNYYNNGNTGFHYDKQLGLLLGPVTDYQIASYIEDIR